MSRTNAVDPLERAARALCTLDGHPENIRFEGAPMWQSYMPQVRAVVSAIREANNAMLGAGIVAAARPPEERKDWPPYIARIFGDMIGAALREGE